MVAWMISFLTNSLINIDLIILQAQSKSKNKFILTNNLKTDYLCDLKLWFMYFYHHLFIYAKNTL